MYTEKLAQTYVRHNDQWFFVSTINRSSSVPDDDGIFSETIAWKIRNDNTREDIVSQSAGLKDDIMGHNNIVEQLFNLGRITEQRR